MNASSWLRLAELGRIAEAIWPEAAEDVSVRSMAVLRVLTIVNGDEAGASPEEAARVRELVGAVAEPGDEARR